jgi:FKBP-type peptidyl-prolyl cis-trans isomerase 2
MKTGEAKQVIVKPEEGYGPSDPELFREIEKTKLPAGQTLVKGMEVEVNLEGTPLPGTVFEVKARTVVMDFNHPLAGKTLVYDVKIAAVGQTPATNDATEPPPEKRR